MPTPYDDVGTGATAADAVEAQQRLRARLREIVRDPHADHKSTRQYLGTVGSFWPTAPPAVAGRHVFWDPRLTDCAACVYGSSNTIVIGKAAYRGHGTSGSLGQTFIHEVEHLFDLAGPTRETDEFNPRLRQMVREVGRLDEASIQSLVGRHARDHADFYVDWYFGRDRGHELTSEQREAAINMLIRRAREESERRWSAKGVVSRRTTVARLVAALKDRLEPLVDKYRKQYPGLDEDDVIRLNRIDPTGDRAEYTEWLVRQFGNRKTPPRGIDSSLDMHHAMKGKRAFKELELEPDINRYGVDDLRYDGPIYWRLRRARTQQGERVNRGTIDQNIAQGQQTARRVYDDNGWSIWEVDPTGDLEGAIQTLCRLTHGGGWCVGGDKREGHDDAHNYLSRGPVYVLFEGRARRGLYSPAYLEFRNAWNQPIDATTDPMVKVWTDYAGKRPTVALASRTAAPAQKRPTVPLTDDQRYEYENFRNQYPWLTEELFYRLIHENVPSDVGTYMLGWVLKQYGIKLGAAKNGRMPSSNLGVYHALRLFGALQNTYELKGARMSSSPYDYTADQLIRLVPQMQRMLDRHTDDYSRFYASVPNVYRNGGNIIYRVTSIKQLNGNPQYRKHVPAMERLLQSGPVFTFANDSTILGQYSPSLDEIQPWTDGAADTIEELWQDYQASTDHAAQTHYEGETEHGGSETASRRATVVSVVAAPSKPSAELSPALEGVFNRNSNWLTREKLLELNRSNDPSGDEAQYTSWIVQQYRKRQVASNGPVSTQLGVYKSLYYQSLLGQTPFGKRARPPIGVTVDQLARMEPKLKGLWEQYQKTSAGWHGEKLMRPVYVGKGYRVYGLDDPRQLAKLPGTAKDRTAMQPTITHYLAGGPVYLFMTARNAWEGLYSPSQDAWAAAASGSVDALEEVWEAFQGTPEGAVPTHHRDEQEYSSGTASRRSTVVAATIEDPNSYLFRVVSRLCPWLKPPDIVRLSLENDPSADNGYGDNTIWIAREYAKKHALNPMASLRLGVKRPLYLYGLLELKYPADLARAGYKLHVQDYSADEMVRLEPALERLYHDLSNKRSKKYPAATRVFDSDEDAIFQINTAEQVDKLPGASGWSAAHRASVDHYLESGPVYVIMNRATALGLYSPALDEYQPWAGTVDVLEELWGEYTMRAHRTHQVLHRGDEAAHTDETASRRVTVAAVTAAAAKVEDLNHRLQMIFYRSRRDHPWLTPDLLVQVNRENDPTGDHADYTEWLVRQYGALRAAQGQTASTMMNLYEPLQWFVRFKYSQVVWTEQRLSPDISHYTGDQMRKLGPTFQRMFHGNVIRDTRGSGRLSAVYYSGRHSIYLLRESSELPLAPGEKEGTHQAAVDHYLASGPVYLIGRGGNGPMLGLYSPSMDEYQPWGASVDELEEAWDDYQQRAGGGDGTHYEGEVEYGGSETASRRATVAGEVLA